MVQTGPHTGQAQMIHRKQLRIGRQAAGRFLPAGLFSAVDGDAGTSLCIVESEEF